MCFDSTMLLTCIIFFFWTTIDAVELNENRIYCVHPNITTPIYISPPFEQGETISTALLNGTWVDDDWNIGDSTNSIQAPITDKRWERFPIIESDHLNFTNKISVAASMYVRDQISITIELFVGGNGRSKTCTKPNNKSDHRWVQYSVIFINDTTYCLEDGQIFGKIKDIYPTKIAFKSSDITFWRPHQYSFKASNTTTKSKTSVLKTTESCIVVYMLLNESSFLEVGFDTYKNQFNSTYINNSLPLIKLWQEHIILLNPDQENNISFRRGSLTTSENGYWGIDVRSCPQNNSNMGIYKSLVPEITTESQCNILNTQNLEKNKNVNAETENSTICSEILGRGFITKNCKVSVCTCIQGDQDSTRDISCPESCPNDCDRGTGKCKENNSSSTGGSTREISCPEPCPNDCDRETGKCKENSSTNTGKIVTVVLVIIALPILVIGGIYIKRTKCKPGNSQDAQLDGEEQDENSENYPMRAKSSTSE